MHKRYLVALVSSAAGALPSVASAQQSAADDVGALSEIVVTAQRREQLVTDVPIAITAVDGDSLRAAGIQSVSDLKFQTPGFISQSGTGYTQLYIRGVGNAIYVGADPSVATFIDDVPRTYGSLVDNFINVERVEVLKGAQGGLYGRNATGGVVNIITRQPGDEPAMRVNVSTGEYQLADAAAYVNIPFSETAAANVSLARRVHDPHIKNLARLNPYPPGTTSFFGDPNAPIVPSRLNDEDFYGLDGKFRLNLTETLKVTLSGDYSRKNDAGGNGWVQRDPAFNYLVYRGYAQAAGISNPLPPWPVPPRRSAYASIEHFSKTEDYGGSARVDLALGGVDLSSISALRWNNSNFRGDLGAAPVPMAGFETDFNRKSFYQELRFVSTGTGPLRFVGGATYFRDTIVSRIDGLFVGFPLPPTDSTVRSRNYSVYGEISYDLTEALTLTGSARYIGETKRAFFPPQAGLPADTARTKQKKLLPSATLSFDLGDGLVYARYARGFKTGGINPLVLPAAFLGQPGSTFGGETVDTFEGGYKAQLFERRVQLTTAVFYNDYKGLQIARAGNAANPLVSNAILNAGTARTYGAEAAATWRVIPEVTVSANIGYLNARYKNAGSVGSPVVDAFVASGNRMSLAPEWQGGASVDFNVPLSDSLRIKGNVLYSYVDRFNHQYEEDPLLEQPGYSVVNTRIGLATMDERFALYAFANNLFDEYYTIFGTKNSVGVLTTEAPPRVAGATFEARF